MTNKKLITVVLLLVLVSSGAFAGPLFWIGLPVSITGFGIAVSQIIYPPPDGDVTLGFVGVGIGLAGGLMMVFDILLSDDNSTAQVKNDNVLRHVSLGTTQDGVFLGARFSF